jgi:hypothetical protein
MWKEGRRREVVGEMVRKEENVVGGYTVEGGRWWERW